MKYIQFVALSFILLSCQQGPQSIEKEGYVEELIKTENPEEGKADLITYEGGKYSPDRVVTAVFPNSDSLYSTIVDISTGVGKETKIELRYYLKIGEFTSGDFKEDRSKQQGGIVFHEALNDFENKFTSDYLDDNAIGIVEVFGFDGETWNLKFEGADGTLEDYFESNESFKYYRCGAGVVRGVKL